MALDDEPRKKLPPASVQEEGEEGAEKAIMSVAGTGAGVGGDTAVPVPVAAACYFCAGAPAVVHCRADSAGLCLPCDRHVHGANTVSSRHARAPLCAACRAAPASCRRRGRFLCSDCDLEDHHRGVELELELEPPPPLHDRATVEGYTGCPTVGELAAILGVHHGCVEKPATADGGRDDDGWWSVWEEPQVLSLDDVIVPTTSCHGLQPLLNLHSSSPKNRSSPCGELEGEVLRQLRELSKSEAAAYAEAEPAGDQLPPWASSEYGIGHGDFGALGTEASYAVPSCEREAWIATDCTDSPDARYAEAEAARQEVPASSSAAEPSLTSFVEISDVCPGMSRSGTDVNGGSHDHPPPVAVQPAQAQPKNGGYDIAYPDRGTVISRYKEKRKNRRFGKQIRYESRKARADGRLRINGRFAKSN